MWPRQDGFVNQGGPSPARARIPYRPYRHDHYDDRYQRDRHGHGPLCHGQALHLLARAVPEHEDQRRQGAVDAATKRSVNRATQALKLAAATLRASQSALGAYYRRMRARMDECKAVTAAAHKLEQHRHGGMLRHAPLGRASSPSSATL